MSKNKVLLQAALIATTILISCTSRNLSSLSPLSPLGSADVGKPYPTTPSAIVTPDPAVSPLVISGVIHTPRGEEIIIITNISDSEQNLKGMALLDPVTMEYVILPNFTLPPGDSFRVYNGPGTEKIVEGIKWLDRPVLRQSGDYIVLLNPAGRAIWYYVNP